MQDFIFCELFVKTIVNKEKYRAMKKHMGKVLFDSDFIIFRPNRQYRTNSNLLIINPDNPVLMETGIRDNPPIHIIQQALDKYGKTSDDVKYLIISHSHQDHFQNLNNLRKNFKSLKVICHKADAFDIKYPFLLPKSWGESLQFKGMSKPLIKFYTAFYMIGSQFFFRTLQGINRIDYTISKDSKIKVNNEYLEMIQTPGHSPGHISIIDSRKNLYLADFVPFTPWVDPTNRGINDTLESIDKLLQYSESRIKRSVRSHGDIRRATSGEWEVSSWGVEREKFKIFKNAILEMLEKIPKKIAGKKMNIYEITSLINPNFRKYSKIMDALFIPPAISWGIGYVLKLMQEGKLHETKKRGKIAWTA
jgi:glyoxylase-like metal-dependent hydrolase (beta-lactamase superfamily II)